MLLSDAIKRRKPRRKHGSRSSSDELNDLNGALLKFWEDTDSQGEHDPARVYHGTTGKLWRTPGGTWGGDHSPLHLSADPNESVEYAILRAQGDRDAGKPYNPRVYLLDLDLEYEFVRDNMKVEVDHGFDEDIEATEQSWNRLSPRQKAMWKNDRAWQVAAQETGFFVLSGDTEKLKARMREVPRVSDGRGGYRWPSVKWSPDHDSDKY